ncbi:MAG TPA: hypothetical protein VGH92_08500 [Gaiellaceae bacterium]
MNERIAENARRFDAGSTEFICECDDPLCTERVEATLEEYEDVRADGARFLLAIGHGDNSIERIVDRREDHDIVEKVSNAARTLVRRLDPRAAEA